MQHSVAYISIGVDYADSCCSIWGPSNPRCAAEEQQHGAVCQHWCVERAGCA